MKLPPLMNSLKYMLIPISNVTFDEPNPYQLYERPYLSNVLLQTVNENGNVICSSQFLLSQQKRPFPVPSGSGQLIQISLTFWAMNNIPMPTLEHIQRKAAQLRDALKLNYNVQLRKKVKKKYSIILPIGPPPLLQNNQPTKSNNDAEMNLPRGPQQRKGKWTLSETRKGRYTWKWIIKKKKKTKEQKKKSRQKSGEKRKRRRIAKLLAAEEKKRQKMGRQNILSEKTEVPSPSH